MPAHTDIKLPAPERRPVRRGRWCFKNLSLSAKFYLALIPLVVMAVIVIFVARQSLRNNAQALIVAREVKELAITSQCLLFQQDDATKVMLIDMLNPDASQHKIDAYDLCQKTFTRMKMLTTDPTLTGLIDQMDKMDDGELQPIDSRVLEAMGNGDAELARKIYFKEYAPKRTEYEGVMNHLCDQAEAMAQQADRKMSKKNQDSVRNISMALVAGGLLVAATMLGITRHVSRQLRATTRLIEDEAEATARSSHQLRVTSNNLAEGNSAVAASLVETSSSLNQMALTTSNTATSMGNAKAVTNQACAAAEKGVADMQTLDVALKNIKNSSDGIAKIIKTIDEIAFQTNILALNAAVEAARAGEAGLGFAVVAEEVRNLARRSAEAARETDEHIKDSINKSRTGVDIGERVAKTFADIAQKIRHVDSLAAEIASASRSQSDGLAQINSAVSQIDASTQNSAAIAEESASACHELDSQAAVLKQAVADLQTLIDGRSPAKAAARANGAIPLNRAPAKLADSRQAVAWTAVENRN
jgi:methyl-accepting chemotaxis protein